MSQQFLPHYHIRRQQDFERAYGRRRAVSDRLLMVCPCENGLQYPRIGLSVSRKVGGAVVRNRWKRLLREAFRLTFVRLPAGIDMVVIPHAAEIPTVDALQASLARLAGQAVNKLNAKPA